MKLGRTIVNVRNICHCPTCSGEKNRAIKGKPSRNTMRAATLLESAIAKLRKNSPRGQNRVRTNCNPIVIQQCHHSHEPFRDERAHPPIAVIKNALRSNSGTSDGIP